MSDYHRYDSPRIQFGPRMTSAVRYLIIANVVVFLVLMIVGRSSQSNHDLLIRIFGLSPQGAIGHGMIWQFATYLFLHGGFWHIFVNMLILWMFGCDLEAAWGSRPFLFYYFLTGVGAGVFSALSTIESGAITIGASGAIFGILVAFGMAFPNSIVLAFFFFPMRAKHFVLLVGLIELFATFNYQPSGIARFAHLGGMVVGFVYLRYGERIKLYASQMKGDRHPREPRIEADLEEEKKTFIKDHIDPILDKIAKQGIDTLTEREKKLLKSLKDKFSRK